MCIARFSDSVLGFLTRVCSVSGLTLFRFLTPRGFLTWSCALSTRFPDSTATRTLFIESYTC